MVDTLPQQVRVKAPCRIHLGLLSVQHNEGRRFGGAGVMLRQPALQLVARLAKSNSCSGPLADRAEAFVRTWRQHTQIDTPFQIDIQQAPPQHVGLGLGTQLGMSVATALDQLVGERDVAVSERAASVGRGLRSAVGAYGFQQGGLIVENGKRDGDTLGQLETQVSLPASWRVMLVRMKDTEGLAGNAEIEAFQALGQSPVQPQSDSLRETLFQELLPAAQTGDFERFAEAVFRYGYKAGEMFAKSQGGPFLNESIARFVDYCRHHGVMGVGQSSWGPTVFCWFRSSTDVDAFRQEYISSNPNLDADVTVSAVSPCGAEVTAS